MSLITSFEFIPLYKREIGRLKDELLAFRYEDLLWEVRGDINNCAGNLTLHLAGNLNHFIGAVLGQNGYVRNRDAEFSTKNVPRDKMLRQLDELTVMIENVLQQLNDEQVLAPYPLPFFGEGTKTAYVLTHLLSHLDYHLGQISYLRRMGDCLKKMETDF